MSDKDDTLNEDMGELFANDSHSIDARKAIREKLQTDIEAFLARGGQIEQLAADATADPPKKPESKYGSQPI